MPDCRPVLRRAPRHEELAAVASAVFHQLGVQKVDVVALARTLATETTERHLQLWDSKSRGTNRRSRELGASGDIDTDDPTRTFHVAVENATATKLDYFVDVAISDTVTISPNGSATVDTSVKLTNHAPAGQPPSYQLGPDGINSHVSGEYVGRVFLWGPRGSVQKGSVDESGLSLAPEIDLPVTAGSVGHGALCNDNPQCNSAMTNYNSSSSPNPASPPSHSPSTSCFGNANHGSEIPDQDHHVDLGVSTDLAQQVT